jgi:hypothetical protein
MEQQGARRYWLWVTHPEYYLDDDGRDREDLDPGDDLSVADVDGWWTCHRDTEVGDLALLYRAKGNGPLTESDIAYLIQAESDAYRIDDDEYARERNWLWGCDYRVLRKFERPLTYSEISADPYLEDWSALRGRFQRRAWEVPEEIWRRLTALFDKRRPGYERQVVQIERSRVAPVRRGEEQLEDALEADIAILRPSGFDLKVVARQRICEGHGGRIDLLCRRRHGHGWVVVEIKNVRAGRNTLAQIQEYMGWVRQRLADDREPVEGLVVSRGCDVRFEAALAVAPDVSQVNVEDVGLD